MASPFGFPRTVHENAARLVAAGVVIQTAAFLAIRQWWVLVPLVYGFLARVAAGPRYSPLALLVTKVIVPRLPGEQRSVPGPPKRFAQGIGLVFSTSILVTFLLGAHTAAYVLAGGLIAAAALESIGNICLGCLVFRLLMRWRIIPASVCAECNDITARLTS